MTRHHESRYELEPNSGVLIRREYDPQSFSYSDSSEDFLRKLFKSSTDLSVSSSQLSAAITDWPTEYHLSKSRSNLLAGFDLSTFRSVLEIGCGCGAITRQLGELGLSVTALDGSFARTAATRERCRDLENVEVICDSFQSFEHPERFDLVTLVGVLEYAPMFFDGEAPFESMLTRAKSFLKPDGVLLIAIENLLGLKYFAGHEEDHVAKPFWGIQDLYQPKQARTLGRIEIDNLLKKVGFAENTFYYPFPDYKIPSVLISERALSHPLFAPAEVIAGHDSRSYNSRVNLTFDEALVWASLSSNNLISHLSNSFLIFSSCTQDRAHVESPWLAKHFSRSHSDADLVITSFTENARGDIEVSKVTKDISSGESQEVVQPSAYVPGKNLLFLFRRHLASHGSLQDAAILLYPWVQLLMEMRSVAEGHWSTWELPSDAFDCVPHNIIIRDQKAVFIDREPLAGFETGIKFTWVIIRGLLLSLAKTSNFGPLEGNTADYVVRQLARLYGLELTDVELDHAMECERRAIFGDTANSNTRTFLETLSHSPLRNRLVDVELLPRDYQRQYSEVIGQRDANLRLLRGRVANLEDARLALAHLRKELRLKEQEIRQIETASQCKPCKVRSIRNALSIRLTRTLTEIRTKLLNSARKLKSAMQRCGRST